MLEITQIEEALIKREIRRESLDHCKTIISDMYQCIRSNFLLAYQCRPVFDVLINCYQHHNTYDALNEKYRKYLLEKAQRLSNSGNENSVGHQAVAHSSDEASRAAKDGPQP